MSRVIIETAGGPLTEDDFEGDAPPLGSSDDKYSDDFRTTVDEIVERGKMAQSAEERE